MPTYEYACTSCGHEFERFESITKKPNPNCPKCSKKKAQRRISGGGGFLFKGSGFYITDYKRQAAPASDTKPADSKPAGDSPSKPESKPCGASCDCAPAKPESKASGKSGKPTQVA